MQRGGGPLPHDGEAEEPRLDREHEVPRNERLEPADDLPAVGLLREAPDEALEALRGVAPEIELRVEAFQLMLASYRARARVDDAECITLPVRIETRRIGRIREVAVDPPAYLVAHRARVGVRIHAVGEVELEVVRQPP